MLQSDLAFGRFRLQPGKQLLRDGVPVALGAKPLGILSALVAAEGELVTKDELISLAWAGMVVEENTLQAHISALRKTLGDEARRVVTVPGRGYRFSLLDAVPGEAPKIPASPSDNPGDASFPSPSERRRRHMLRPASLGAAAVLMTVIVTGALVWRSNPGTAPQMVRVERYLVLPFVNRTGDLRNEDLADELTDAIAGRLAAQSWDSQVVDHTQAFAYKGKPVNEAKLSRELDLNYIIEGDLLPGVGGMEASATIVDARTGSQIATVAARQVSGVATDRLSLAAPLVDHVLSSIFRHEKRLIDAGLADDRDIRNLLIRAETSWGDPTVENSGSSMRLIDMALSLDPHNIHALALAADFRIELVTAFAYHSAAERNRLLDQAEADLMTAARLDPTRTIVRMKLGDLRAAQGRHDAARAEFEHVLSLDPSNAHAWDRLAMEDVFTGRPEEAAPKLDRARRLDPDDAFQIDQDTAFMLLNLGRDDDALAALRQAITIKPTSSWATAYLAGLLTMTGHRDEARAALVKLRQIAPGITIAKLRMADVNASPRYLQSQERLYAALRQAGLEEERADADPEAAGRYFARPIETPGWTSH